jgi:hypothetical protein
MGALVRHVWGIACRREHGRPWVRVEPAAVP